MKYCVLGAGRTGQAMAAYLIDQGLEVGLWDRNQEKCRVLATNGITLEGLLAGTYRPVVTSSIQEAARAEILLVTTTAGGHLPVARLLRGLLRPGQLILILNGNMGGWEFYAALRDETLEKEVIIAETGGMLLLCDYNAEGVLFFRSLKDTMNLASIPAAAAPRVIERLAPEFPQFYPVSSVVETSLNNANPVLHVPISLFNLSRIENGEEFGFYSTAASPSILAFVEALDAERCAVIRAMGFRPLTCLEIINSFWPEKHNTLTDAIQQNTAYQSAKGPKSLEYRYITEDIPFGIAPVASLGALLHVPTPCTDALLVCFQTLLAQDLLGQAPCLDGFLTLVRT